ncbi:hypothetical protein FSPOR_6547 [Fusarium sporotrichioides]|uniref:Uncharacterized protein n=1 Tax=Fusarium sporotrichioides TaxID=5514 RepID=A0A395S289_FUSSP|nr:hypothetical protein FSPOR_6547 [Fusarium sporotrichioides]
MIPFLIEHGVYAVAPDDLPLVFRSKRGRSLPCPTDRNCQEPAVVEGTNIPPFSERQDLPDPASEDHQVTDERPRYRLVRMKLWELTSTLCGKLLSPYTDIWPHDAFEVITALLKDADGHIAEAEGKSTERKHRGEGSEGSVLEDDNELGCLFPEDE